MKLEDFTLEKWLNPLVASCKVNLGASCIKALRIDELFELAGENLNEFLGTLSALEMHYGEFSGTTRLREAVAKMYRNVTPEMVLTVHGGTGGNNMVLTELAEPEDNVVVIVPNYQQHYSIPQSLGAEVRKVKLKPEHDYVLDMDELGKAVDSNTKLIALSNPNNPTGVYLGEEKLKELAEIARSAGAYILSDEIYRGLEKAYMLSIVDVYERGIVSSSMSKVFAMAGTRVGWLVTSNRQVWERLENRRSYDTICGGVIDETLAAIALEHHETILERGRKLVQSNKEILDDWLKTQPHLERRGDSIGTTCFIQYDFDIPTVKFCQDVLDATGLLLCHGACFDEEHCFRLGYSFDEGETLIKGLEALDSYIKRLEGGTDK